jgi:hypothetical protein
LSRVRADADVDKSLAWWPLHDRTTEIRRDRFAAPDANGEFETEVFAFGSLLLGCFVLSASPHLHAVIHTRWWFFQDDSEGQFMLHVCSRS